MLPELEFSDSDADIPQVSNKRSRWSSQKCDERQTGKFSKDFVRGARWVGTHACDSMEALAGLASFASVGDCIPASFHRDLGKNPVVPAYGFTPSSDVSNEILPLVPSIVDGWLVGRNCVMPKGISASDFKSCLRGTVLGFNFLYGAGFSDRPVLPAAVGPISEAQERLLEFLWFRVLDFSSGGVSPLNLAEVCNDLSD